jgi:hypothetical protein
MHVLRVRSCGIQHISLDVHAAILVLSQAAFLSVKLTNLCAVSDCHIADIPCIRDMGTRGIGGHSDCITCTRPPDGKYLLVLPLSS